MPGTSKGRTDRATLNKAKQEFSTTFNQGSDVMRRCPGKTALMSSGERRGQASRGVGERAWQQKLPAPQGTATWSIFPPASLSLQTLTPVHTRQQGHPHTPNSPPEELASSQGKKDPPEPPGAGNWHLSALLMSGHCGSRRPAEQGERTYQESTGLHAHTHAHTPP